MIDTTPHMITSLLAMGMALAFIIADRSSPTSRALALFLVSIGLSIGIGSQIAYPRHYYGIVAWWDGAFAIPEAMAFFFAYEWILRVRRTVPAAGLKTSGPDRLLRIGQALTVFYLLAAIAFPRVRAEKFMNGAATANASRRRDSARSGRRRSISRPENSDSASEMLSGSANSQNSGSRAMKTSWKPAFRNFSTRMRGNASAIRQ